jgi:hypothetical protein
MGQKRLHEGGKEAFDFGLRLFVIGFLMGKPF